MCSIQSLSVFDQDRCCFTVSEKKGLRGLPSSVSPTHVVKSIGVAQNPVLQARNTSELR
jgi:hypothetical protein